MDLPWFKIYAAEVLSDENFQGWDVTERGSWFTLLCVEWREGSIPGDMQSLAKLLHLDSSAMRAVWSAIGSRFVPHPDHPGRLASPRMEKEREDAERLSNKKADSGRRGARSRWDKEKKRHGRRMGLLSGANATPMANDGDPDPDPRQDKGGQPSQEEERLAAVQGALAARLRVERIGIGKDRERVTTTFGRWLDAVGLDGTVAECERLARERQVTPAHLAWWCGWLETVPDAELRRAP